MNAPQSGELYLLPGVFLIAAISFLLCIPSVVHVQLGMLFQFFAFTMAAIASVQALLNRHQIICVIAALIAIFYNPILSAFFGYQSVFMIDYMVALFFFGAALYISNRTSRSVRKDLI